MSTGDLRDPACTMKFCEHCGVTKPVEQFHMSNKYGEPRPTRWCRLCWNERARRLRAQEDPAVRQARQRARLYKRLGQSDPGLRLCLICEDNLATDADHDHECCPGPHGCEKCFRGWLCGPCNKGLGHFRDRADWLRRAAQYLDGELVDR